MRNKLVHRYFGSDPDLVWLSAVENLPPLHDQLKRILTDMEGATA